MTIAIRWRPFIIAFTILFLTYGGYFYWDNYIKIIPEELMGKTIQRLSGLEGYTYKMELKLISNGHERQISSIKGERKDVDNFHLIGVIEGTPVEAYHLENTTYLKAGEAGKWMVIEGNKVFDQDLFMVEIDPLASFNFIKVEDLIYQGRKEIDGQKAHQLTFTPQLEHPFMNKHWFNFQYTLWLRTNGELIKGEVKGNLKARPEDQLFLILEIIDYDPKINLRPPAL